MATTKRKNTKPNPDKSSALSKLIDSYGKYDQMIKIIDVMLVCIMFTGIIQFIYMGLVGTYPYNAFLSGFGCSVGMFVNTANLRIQFNDKNLKITKERAFADYAVSNFVLYFFCICFIG